MTYRPRRSAAATLVAVAGAVITASAVLTLHPAAARTMPKTVSAPSRALNVRAVYDKLEPAVVDVSSALRAEGETAEGTGFVLSAPDALVLTNNHVIRDARAVSVTLTATGKHFPARVVGTDAAADVALLQIRGATGLVPAALGDSAAVQVGTPVLALGNQAGEGGPPAVAPGVITGLNETIKAGDPSSGFTETLARMLATSADIAPGDSGGPLADAAGQVIGMDTATSAGKSGTTGYAIPIATVLAATRLLLATRAVPGPVIATGAVPGQASRPRRASAPPQNKSKSGYLTDPCSASRPPVLPRALDPASPSPSHPILPNLGMSVRVSARPSRGGTACRDALTPALQVV